MVKGILSGGDSESEVTVLTYVTVHRPFDETIKDCRVSLIMPRPWSCVILLPVFLYLRQVHL